MKPSAALMLFTGCAVACGARTAPDGVDTPDGGGGEGGSGSGSASSGATTSASVSTSVSASSSSAASSAASTSVASSGTGGCSPAPEECNGIDDNCNGAIDEPIAAGCQVFFRDDDEDGWGDTGDSQCLCAPSGPYDATLRGDCDDLDPSVHPGAFELCNGIDDDCNGVVDDGLGLCDCPSLVFGGKTYLFCTNAKTWFDASDHCAATGFHLVSIGTAAEDAWLFDEINQLSGEKWWMGMNDLAVEGSWGWQDASPVTYLDWEPGEPNDAGGEDCGQLNRFFPADTWNDEPCDQPLAFVCESF